MFDMGKELKKQRQQRHMTQEQVARALEVSAITVGRWENNYKTPSLDHLVALAVLFNVSINQLTGIREESVIVIDRMSQPQQHLMVDIAAEFTAEEKSEGLSGKQIDILGRLLNEFLKGE